MHFAFWICLLLYLCVASAVQECFDPQGRTGVCKPLIKCKHILYMLGERGSNRTKVEVNTFIGRARDACKRRVERIKSVDVPIVCCKNHQPYLPYLNCGERSVNRIANGRDSNPLEFPWMVRLLRSDGVQEAGICGGSLINANNALTAAHCFIPKPNVTYYVVLGEHDTKTKQECLRGRKKCIQTQKILVEKIIKHHRYTSEKLDNDIAILHLKTPVDLTDGTIQPICLPTLGIQQPQSMIFTGWGVTEQGSIANVLQKAEAEIINRDECRQKIVIKVHDNSFCAHFHTNSSTCIGDSGGPLIGEVIIRNKWRRFFQFGLISRGSRNCTGLFPSVYLNVTSYVNWIEENKKK